MYRSKASLRAPARPASTSVVKPPFVGWCIVVFVIGIIILIIGAPLWTKNYDVDFEKQEIGKNLMISGGAIAGLSALCILCCCLYKRRGNRGFGGRRKR